MLMEYEGRNFKVDPAGRITLPSFLRKKYNWQSGELVECWTHTDENGKKWICFTKAEEKHEN